MKKLSAIIFIFLVVYLMPTAVDAALVPADSVASDLFSDDLLNAEYEDLECLCQDQESSQEKFESNSTLELDADDDLIPEIILQHYFLSEVPKLRLVLINSFVLYQNNQPPPRQ
jgi:hypothetical protein